MKSLWFSTGEYIATMIGMLSELQTRLDEPDAIGGISAGAMIAAVLRMELMKDRSND